jgi:N-6 DNA Methylase
MSLFIQGKAALQEIERAMQAIGYRGELLRRNYRYENVIASHHQIHTIDLAGFAQSQPTYRNACIGVVVSNGLSGEARVAQHRSLGAPLVFEISGTRINRWKITASGEPEFRGSIPYENIISAFSDHESEWKPESILTLKAIGEVKGPIQLDFYDEKLMPFLEGRNFIKLDYLLHEVLRKTAQAYRQLNHRALRSQDLFPLAFRFIAAKVFRDRGYIGGWTSNDAITALRAIEQHYNTRQGESSPSDIYSQAVLDEIWKIFISTFNFPNLSEDDLALVFEKTFITPATRRTLGIHSTPPRVAEYIVRKLPLDDLPEDSRHVLEPFAGHGKFLVAAMRRMNDIFSAQLSDTDRHSYFRRHLVGIEIEHRSVEICRLALTLADSPNRNGWQIYNEDVFASGTLERELRRSQIVLCNPPFERFHQSKRKQYNDAALLPQKPAELLRRVLLAPPEIIGLVLPRNFESGSSYSRFHRELASNYGSVELVALPEVFNFSGVETMLVLASERRRNNEKVFVACRTVTKQNRDEFLNYGKVPQAITDYKLVPEISEKHFSLWIPRLTRIWDYLRANPVLSSIAVIHHGLHWKANVPAVLDEEKPGYMKGVALVKGHLMQYVLQGQQYLSRRREHQYDTAYKFAWERPKVVCNRVRFRRQGWRVGAAADPKGLIFSNRFFGLWPSESISIYALAAFLNSPLPSAYIFAKDEGWSNRTRTMETIPIPPEEFLEIGSKLDVMSQQLHRIIRRNIEEAKALLLQIDAEVLKAYDLPPALEHELLDTFQGVKRPVPFEFIGYYPKDFDAYIPLHELISQEFEEARADRLLERLVMINDPEVSEAMAMLRGESLDEGLPS